MLTQELPKDRNSELHPQIPQVFYRIHPDAQSRSFQALSFLCRENGKSRLNWENSFSGGICLFRLSSSFFLPDVPHGLLPPFLRPRRRRSKSINSHEEAHRCVGNCKALQENFGWNSYLPPFSPLRKHILSQKCVPKGRLECHTVSTL